MTAEDEPLDPPTREEEEGAAWEYWYEAAHKHRIENERLRKLVRSAYSEGFSEGMNEFTRSRGGKPWEDSRSRAALEGSPLSSALREGQS